MQRLGQEIYGLLQAVAQQGQVAQAVNELELSRLFVIQLRQAALGFGKTS